MPKLSVSRFVILGLLFVSLAIVSSACQPQGIPGSFLLTPAYLRSPAAATTQEVDNPPTLAPTPLPDEPTFTPELSEPLPSASPVQPTNTLPASPSTPAPTVDFALIQSPTPTRPASRKPTPTRTPTPALGRMRIQQPGPYSKVSAPFTLEAVVSPGADKFVYLELIGEDGRMLHRQDLSFRNYTSPQVKIRPEVTFEITAVAETGRLTLYSLDAFERVTDLVSVDLVLMQIGNSDFYAATTQEERYIIRLPQEGSRLRGGLVAIEGLARLVNDRPLIATLLDESGEILAQSEVTVSQPYGDISHVPFDLLLTYTVNKRTAALLTFSQESAGRLPGTVYLSSVELTLEP